MKTTRLEAFSDGVLAIVITIMVLELKIPHEQSFEGLLPLMPVFFTYLLSFIYVGIYWNNHHHMLTIADVIDGKTLWANLHLLFWLSLIPFATSWLGEHPLSSIAVAFYGFILLMSAIAYHILTQVLVHFHKKNTKLTQALKGDIKGRLSIILYSLGVATAFIYPGVSLAIYISVALIWLIPDRRIERKL